MKIKETKFDISKAKNDYFDLVSLEDIYVRKPNDHNQFEHHKISFFVIVLITNGLGKHSINYNDYSFEKGSVFLLRKNSIHKFYKNQSKGVFLVFTENFIIRYSNKIQILRFFQLFNEMLGSLKIQLNSSEYIEIEKVLQLIQNEYLSINDNHSVEIIRNLIQVLLNKLLRIKSNVNINIGYTIYHSQFKILQELIEEDCFESKKVSYYANKMEVTSRTLNNITQSIIGKSAKSFIDEVLIIQVKRLIINSHLSFTQIAYKAGFDDPTNFFKYFRKQTGISPKQFKEKHK